MPFTLDLNDVLTMYEILNLEQNVLNVIMIAIAVIALCLCIFFGTVVNLFKRKDKENQHRLLNVLYGHLAILYQVGSILMFLR